MIWHRNITCSYAKPCVYFLLSQHIAVYTNLLLSRSIDVCSQEGYCAISSQGSTGAQEQRINAIVHAE
jgi:hypothetical protein